MARPTLRSATTADAPGVAAIYAHHVLTGTATFDIDPPTEQDWAVKIENVLDRRWPFQIAEHDAAVIGGGEPASVALHCKLGFVEAGRIRNVGQKFGRLLDTFYMQRALSPA